MDERDYFYGSGSQQPYVPKHEKPASDNSYGSSDMQELRQQQPKQKPLQKKLQKMLRPLRTKPKK